MEARRALAASGEAYAVSVISAGMNTPKLLQGQGDWALGKALPAGEGRAVLLTKPAADAECRS